MWYRLAKTNFNYRYLFGILKDLNEIFIKKNRISFSFFFDS
jgi:hypothetical protein